jgi:hypothetical protein
MLRAILLKEPLLILALFGVTACLAASPVLASGPQRNEEALKTWIAKKHNTSACHFPGGKTEQVYLNHTEYFDFTNDGKAEVVVVASTCWTGTAGPDVHSVLSAKGERDFVELEIPEPDKKRFAAAKMEGNRNYQLRTESGLLVATWRDESGRRDSPLIVKYKWNGKVFSILTTETAHEVTVGTQ